MGKVFFSDPDLVLEIDLDPESNLAEYIVHVCERHVNVQ